MSRYNDERPSPKGIMRPHSFDIGVHEHQSQQDRTKGRGRGRGVYKSGSGTFMFASTSMSAALDNLQFYPKATNAQLTAEHRATIRETVVSQMAPLLNFPKAHTFPGVVVEPYQPLSGRHSADFRRSTDYRRSADFPPSARPPLPSSPRPARPAGNFGAKNVWSPSTQAAMALPRGSTGAGLGTISREQQLASAASSSFFSPTVPKAAAKPVVSSLLREAAQPVSSLLLAPAPESEGKHAELASAAAAAPAHVQRRQSVQHQQQALLSGTAHLHRVSPPLQGLPPTAAAVAKPQYTRATRGSFEQPQTRARGSFEQAQRRARSSFEQVPARSRGSFDDARHAAGGYFDHVPAAGRTSFDQLQTTARRSFDQMHASTHLSPLGAIPEQPYMPSGFSPSQDAQSSNPFSQFDQTLGPANMAHGYSARQLANCQPNPPGFQASLARTSCDYPHAVANRRASASGPNAPALYAPYMDRVASSCTPVSRQSLVASREFARLDEASKRQAAVASLGANLLPPNQLWPEGGADPTPTMGSPFGQWPAQAAVDLQAYQPHALQLHALNTLQAMSRSPQLLPPDYPQFWSQHPSQPQKQAGHNVFPATHGFPANPSFPSPSMTQGDSSGTSLPSWSSHGSQASHHSLQKNGGSPSRPALTEVGGINASDLQGTWGAHLETVVSTPTPQKSGSARGQSYNPFLQPQSTFSIREAKLQLQNPTPQGTDSKGSQARSIPRVDTFASNLHDSWGAHGQHDSPPASESIFDNPPRLSTESVRSAASAASKASSGGSRLTSVTRQGSGRYHHGYGYDPSSDGWKVDCSSGTQKSFSTYTVAKPEGDAGRGGIITAAKELLAEAANAARSAEASTRRTSQDGSSGISPLLDILVNPDTPLPKKRRVLETLTFLAANPAIAYSICEQGGIALLLQVVADPNDGVQLEAAEALQALMTHECAQVAFDQSDGLFKVAPMLSEQLDPITHLAGLHILASFVYSRSRSQEALSARLQEAGLYDAALTLLKSHSQPAELGHSSTHKDTLDWLEASQVGSPMAPLPEGHQAGLEPKNNGESAEGSSLQRSTEFAFQADSAPHSARPLLTTAQTMPLPSATHSAETSSASCRHGGKFPPEQENGANHVAEEAAAASAQGLEENAGCLSGDVTIADQVVLAALEVLFKLASNRQHLLSFRPSLLLEAVSAQLQHGRQARALSRSIQLLQLCCQEEDLLDACSQSECISELLKKAQGSGYVAALASGTLGAMAQSDSVRSVLLRGEGTKPVIRMLGQTNAAIPGLLYLLSCLAEFGDSRYNMLQAGTVPALLRLAESTHNSHTCASATSLLRLLTNSTDRRSTDGIHGAGLNVAGNYCATKITAGGNQSMPGSSQANFSRNSPHMHAGHAFQGFFQL